MMSVLRIHQVNHISRTMTSSALRTILPPFAISFHTLKVFTEKGERRLTSSACSGLIFTQVTCLSPAKTILAGPSGVTLSHSSLDRPRRRTQWTCPDPTILLPQLGFCLFTIRRSHTNACSVSLPHANSSASLPYRSARRLRRCGERPG